MAAVVALYIDKAPDSQQILNALDLSHSVIAAYREQSWHKMPSKSDIEAKKTKKPTDLLSAPIKMSCAPKHLPAQKLIELGSCSTKISGIYTASSEFKQAIDLLLTEVVDGRISIILDGPAGCGKSSIMKFILNNYQLENSEKPLVSLDYSSAFNLLNIDDLDNSFKKLRDDNGLTASTTLFLIVDEVLKPTGQAGASFFERFGVKILNSAIANNIRFLFIDATFKHTYGNISPEIKSRCAYKALPSLSERLCDIPILIASFLSSAKDNTYTSIALEDSVLLTLIDYAMRTELSPREFGTIVTEGLKKMSSVGDGMTPKFLYEYLPQKYRSFHPKYSLNIEYTMIL